MANGRCLNIFGLDVAKNYCSIFLYILKFRVRSILFMKFTGVIFFMTRGVEIFFLISKLHYIYLNKKLGYTFLELELFMMVWHLNHIADIYKYF